MARTRILPFLLLLLVTSLLPATRAAAEEFPPLTSESVRSLLATLPEVKTIGEKYEAEGNPLPDIGGGEMGSPEAMEDMRKGMLTGSLGDLRGHAAWDEFQSMVESHGFDSVAAWANVGDRVMAGFIQLQVAKEAPEARQQMEQAKQQILANDQMPEAQKQQMLKMIEGQMQMFDAMTESEVLQEGDLEVIEPMLDEIRTTMEQQ